MKTHMMGVGMALVGMVLAPSTGSTQGRIGRGHAESIGYSRAKRAETVDAWDSFVANLSSARPEVLAEDLAALIPEGEMRADLAARSEAGVSVSHKVVAIATDRVLQRIQKSGVPIVEAMADKTGIFSFRETEEGTFELHELTLNRMQMVEADAAQENERELGKFSLMARIREL